MSPTRTGRTLLALSALGVEFLAACASLPLVTPSAPAPFVPPVSTSTIRVPPDPTKTPQPTRTSTPSSLPTPTQDQCRAPHYPQLILLDDDRYSSFGPPSSKMDAAVFNLHPQWEHFRQEVLGQSLTIGNVFEQAAFGGPEYGVNPAILLIAVGMRLDWEVPPDGDMFLRAEQAAREMHPHYVAFYTEESYVRRTQASAMPPRIHSIVSLPWTSVGFRNGAQLTRRCSGPNTRWSPKASRPPNNSLKLTRRAAP